MKIQCLYYALDKWNEEGGYLLFRKSTHWCMPHVLHQDERTSKLTHYVPPSELRYPWYSMFGFEGYIKEYDAEPCEHVSPLCMFFGMLALLVFGLIWYIMRVAIRKNRRNKEHERRSAPQTNNYDRRKRNAQSWH